MKSFIKLSGIFIGMTTIFAWQCNSPKDWSDPKDDTPPGPVKNVQVTNLNGGALIEFTRPSDEDLLGVKAVYQFNENDKLRERWASAHKRWEAPFNDTIILEGYGNTAEYIVELYAVDKSGNLSTPEQVRIHPLTPPIDLIRETLEARPTHGGIRTSWKNDDKKSMSVSLYTFDQDGEKVLFDRYFSSADEDVYSFRGLEAQEQRFFIELTDRWGNTSAPLDITLTPWFEELIIGGYPYATPAVEIWKQYGFTYGSQASQVQQPCRWRGDVFSMAYTPAPSGNAFHRLYDRYTNVNAFWSVNTHSLRFFVTGSSTSADPTYSNSNTLAPMYFIIDMGRKAAYSRLKVWNRNRPADAYSFVWYEFEIWGANSVKPVSHTSEGLMDDLRYWTSWEGIGGTDQWKEGWEKLCTCLIRFPSGTDPASQGAASLTTDDLEFFQSGVDFSVDEEMTLKPFQYLRFVLLKTNSTDNSVQFSEIEFHGSYVN